MLADRVRMGSEKKEPDLMEFLYAKFEGRESAVPLDKFEIITTNDDGTYMYKLRENSTTLGKYLGFIVKNPYVRVHRYLAGMYIGLPLIEGEGPYMLNISIGNSRSEVGNFSFTIKEETNYELYFFLFPSEEIRTGLEEAQRKFIRDFLIE